MTNAPSKPLWSTYFAYIGAFLGVMSVVGVACFHYPDLLTSPSVRATYTEEFARILLAVGMTTTAILLIPCLIVGHYKRLSALGLLGLTLALVMGGTSVPLAPRNGSSFSLGLDWFLLALFFSALILVPLERFSGNSQQKVLRPQWKLDLTYFFFAHAAVQFILLASTSGAAAIDGWIGYDPLKEFIRSWPVFVQVIAAVFIADLSQSLIHRAYHRVPWLWRIHQIHHSVEHMDWLAGSRLHIGEILITRMMVLAPLVVLGFSQTALNVYITIVGVQAVLAHANVRWPAGPWEKWIVGPRYHHWHHAKHKDHWDCNYAIHTPLIDRLMGTYRLPEQNYPEKYGILGGARVPEGFIAQHLYAFGKQYLKKKPVKRKAKRKQDAASPSSAKPHDGNSLDSSDQSTKL